MKKVIVDSGLTLHQRFMLSILSICFFLPGAILVYQRLASNSMQQNIGDLIAGLLLIVSFSVIALLVSKEGILISERKLFNAQFLFGKPYWKSEVKLDGMSDVCIISYNLSQKMVFFSVANPDMAEEIKVSKIFVLNENHSTKRLVLSTRKIEHAELVVRSIQTELGLKLSHYHPPNVNRRR